MAEEEPYQMKGNRVIPLTLTTIRQRAHGFCDFFNLTPKSVHSISHAIERFAESNICIDPVDDAEWLFLTEGHCDPTSWTIRVPESTLIAAYAGDPKALFVIFHELGHLMLAHQVVLHSEKTAPPTILEDAEWQADTFAEIILAKLKISIMEQLPLALNQD